MKIRNSCILINMFALYINVNSVNLLTLCLSLPCDFAISYVRPLFYPVSAIIVCTHNVRLAVELLTLIYG